MQTASYKPPFRRARQVVTLTALLTVLAILHVQEMQCRAIILRLEDYGVIFYCDPKPELLWGPVPVLSDYLPKCRSMLVFIETPQDARHLPEIVDGIRRLKISMSINLSGSDDIERDLALLPRDSVTQIQLAGRKISVSVAHQIGKLTKLNELCLSECTLEFQAIKELASCKNLSRLLLIKASIKSEELDSLKELSCLEVNSLADTRLPNEARERLTKSLPGLRVIDN